ncbi:MAG TPA: helix-turn-helix domain-containing protein [Gemmatimonadaceae bacterium]|nr:helix-turn-helix domain-containing protein [Gemmatimonadaceae bacterium]
MLVDTPAAARQLGLSERTVSNWRLQGRGPEYLKLGKRVLYSTHALERFKAANTHGATREASGEMRTGAAA